MKKDITGKRAGRLVVKERLPNSKWLCRCDCGNTRIVNTGHFNAGKIKSCGCHIVRHGHAKNKGPSREYISYHNMISRCHKKTNKRYKDYGAKGIIVCKRWKESFVNFLDDMGKCPTGYQIDRTDNKKGYEPSNCRWVTRKINMRNRRKTYWWYVNGKKYNTAQEAGEDIGVSDNTIRAMCVGRKAGGRYYPPKTNCYAESKY